MMCNYNIYRYIKNNDIINIKRLLDRNIKYLDILYNNLKPIHYACIIGQIDIINLFLEYKNDILNDLDVFNNTGYHYIVLYNDIFKKYLITHQPKNVNKLNDDGINILCKYILVNGDYDNDIFKILSELDANLLEPENKNPLYHIISNNCDKLDIIVKYFKVDINMRYNYKPISFKAIDDNNIKCLKKLIKLGININLVSDVDNILSYSIVKGKEKIINWILDNTNIDYKFTDRHENNYLHIAILYYVHKKKIDKNILSRLIDIIDINKQNCSGYSVIHFILIYNLWDMFKDKIKNLKVNLNLRDKNNNKPLDYIKNKSDKIVIRRELKNIIKSDKSDNLLLIKNKVPNHTCFICNFESNLSYIIYILRKYNNVSFPLLRDNKKLLNSIYNIYVNLNKDSYNIKYSLETLKDVFHNEIVFLLLFININKCCAHINIIIINNKYKTIEHFEPHGKYINDKYIYDIKDKLLDEVYNLTKLKYKYYTPDKYQSNYDFQEISGELIIHYHNEVDGFCGAWIYWYLEHRLLNYKISIDKLIKKLKKKLIQDKIQIYDYIRSYADKLNKYKYVVMKEANIPNKYHNINLNKEYYNKYINYTFNEIHKLTS